MSKPLLKQFGELTPQDFQTHEVWAGCHTIDYDEPWYDDTDEETFRPWTGSLPVGSEQGMLLVRAEALLNDGTRFPGFLTPTIEPGDLGTMQPHVFVDGRPFGLWGGVVGIPETLRLAFFESLDRRHEQVFPLVVAATSDLARGQIRAHVETWPMTYSPQSARPGRRFWQQRR